MQPLRKNKLIIALAVATALIAVYAAAGFWLVPRLIRSALLDDVPKSIDATPSVGEIRFNPFLLQLTVEDLALSGPGAVKLVGLKRLFVDFELSSLWHRAYTFGNIDVTAPYVGAVMAADGTLNLLRLKPKPANPPPPAAPSASLPAIRVGSLKVSQGLVSYEDHSEPDVFAARLEPINFELKDFSTGAEGGRFTFTAATTQGERVEWHGHLSVQPFESDGEFRIDGLLVHTLWEYLEDRVNFVVNSGSIDLAATYKFAGANLNLDVARVALKNLAVRPKGADSDWVEVPELTVTGTAVDLAARHAKVDQVALNGLKLDAWREADGSLNLMTLTAPAAARDAGAKPQPKASLTTNGAAPAAPWTYELHEFDLRDAAISLEDRGAHPVVKAVVAPLNLRVTGLSQDLSKPVGLEADAHLNARGSLALHGQVTAQPLLADLDLKVGDVDLSILQPYIAERSSMTLLGGALGAAAKVHYGVASGAPNLRFTGRIDVDKLHTVDDALHDDFISWDHVEIDGIDFSQGPDRLDIERVLARKLFARVIIEPDSSLNVKRVLAAPATAGARPTTAPSVTAAPVVVAPRPVAAGSSSAKRKTRAAPATVTAAATAPGMPMQIRKIVLESSRAQFSDLSVNPNFATGIQALGGTITGLSSKPDSRATMDLRGSVDAYSPVSISGQFNVLGPKLYADVALSFRNISLPIFNPYSGKFAGYNITEGKLSTELHYKVDGRNLDAQHHVVIEQLEFGDKTASKEAVSLPVKLAVSLLKDRNGVIDLSLPVTGSLDDPQFRLAPIIWKVFVNILEKAVTAPFALLGSLFGGGPDIQYVDFQPGVSAPPAASLEKIKTVARALLERPQLKIEVPIAVVPDVDGPALVAAKYQAELAAMQSSATGRRRGAAAAPAVRPFAELDPAAQAELLTALYAKDFGAEPKYPEAVTAAKTKPELIAAKIDFLAGAIRAHIGVGDADFTALGQARALALQQALLQDTQVDPERVFLVANDKATAKDGAVRLELTLK